MLVRILKSEVAKVWSIIGAMIEISVPKWTGAKVTSRNMVNILEAMMSGDLTGWFIYEDKENPDLLGLITTYFTYDTNGGNKSLSVYNLMSIGDIARKIWFSSFKTLAIFAKTANCKKITIVSEHDKIIKFCKSLGAKTTTILIEWDIE